MTEPTSTTPNTQTPATTGSVAGSAASVLDLDTLEREGAVEPFTFTLNGRVFTMKPRDEIAWQNLLLAQRNPLLFVRFTMSKEDHDAFMEHELEMWKMDRLMQEYLKHFGIDPGEFNGSSGF